MVLDLDIFKTITFLIIIMVASKKVTSKILNSQLKK